MLFNSKKGQVRNYFAALVFLMIFGFANILGYGILFNVVQQYESSGFF